MSKRLGVGIIGLGIGERHIDGYLSDSRCKVLTLSDINPKKLDEVSQRHPNIGVAVDPNQILIDSDIDVVSIASYDNFHFDQVMMAISHGKHVFVEKPLCLFENEYFTIAKELSKNPSLKLSSNLILRKVPRFVELKAKIKSGELGEINYIEGDYDYGRLHKIIYGWRADIPYYSVVLGGAIHLLDLILWLTGARPKEVFAYGNKIATIGSNFRHQDLVEALIKFDSGLIAKVGSNFSSVTPHHHKLSVYGTQGTFLQSHFNALYINSRDNQVKPKIVNSDYPGVQKGDLIPSFIGSIIDGGDAEVSKKDVFDTMAVGFAIERSLNSGLPENINYFDFVD